MGSFIVACGLGSPTSDTAENELFLPVSIIASVRQRLSKSKQTLRILSSTDSFGQRRSFFHLE